jgi:hypothetical protein
MPNSLQAQITRTAISPRLAMRILLNMMEDQGQGIVGAFSSSPLNRGLRPSTLEGFILTSDF